MLLRGGTSPTRLGLYLLLTLTYIGTVHGSPFLFHEIEINKENEGLFREALKTLDIDHKSVKLEALQSKKGDGRTSFVAHYATARGMLCKIKYGVALFSGLHVSSYVCTNIRNGQIIRVPGKGHHKPDEKDHHHHPLNPSKAPKKLILGNRAYRGGSYRLYD